MVDMGKGQPSRSDKLLIVIWIHMWILDQFSSFFTITDYGILRDLLPFLIQSPADFYETWHNDWRQQDNKSTTFWEQYILIRIRINPESRIEIPDQILALAHVRCLNAVVIVMF